MLRVNPDTRTPSGHAATPAAAAGSLSINASEDVEALIVPHREAMKLAYRGLFTTPFPTDDMLRAEWRALLADPQATVLLGSSSGTPVGTLAVRVAGVDGWLERFYVHPDAQHRGIGRALHDHGLELLRAGGCRQANLWVLAVNQAAIQIYRHWGWRPVPGPPSAPWGLPQIRFGRPLAG